MKCSQCGQKILIEVGDRVWFPPNNCKGVIMDKVDDVVLVGFDDGRVPKMARVDQVQKT